MSYIGNQPVLNTSEFREEFAVTSTQTVFNTGGFTASSDSATLEVLRNGVLLGTADYTLGSDASTVTLANAAVNGDIIVIKGRRELTNGVQVTERRHEHTMGSGETTVTFPYPLTVSQTDVYLNGVKLGSSDFSINSSTRVVSFTTNPAVGDLVAIVSREPALTANSSLPVIDAAGTNVLSESGGVVTLTADEANVGSNALVVDSSGNVGIGTSSPSNKLTVQDGSNAKIRFNYSDGNEKAFCNFESSGFTFQMGTKGNDPVVLKTNDTERMRIDSSGNVGVGPSSLVSSWEGNLNIVQPSGTKTELFFLRDTQVEGHIGFLGSNIDSNFYVGTGPALGDYGMYQTNQGTSWLQVSDERQKTNLIPIVDAINKIKQLRTVTGRFLTDEEGISRSFLIAQDFVNNFPEAVDTNNPEKYGLSYTDVIPLIIAGFKEQQTLIESQQSQIDALTARIEALEATP